MMADQIDNGGPAFPVEMAFHNGKATGGLQTSSYSGWATGISLRDYAAIHADQPGMAEIVSMAGLTYSQGQVWTDEVTSIGTFDAWWRTLPNSERFMLSARVRYAIADAMIAARKSTDR